ncbi:DNA translocase FtsK [Streptomyces nanshensis]|uniref:DNA translocase FtsK n=1 Tax=Streptomyces nanshensis TaxID=518642 RepID=UPI00085CC515|nr:DNA translocase FtsK [Streptomyces nanshensis]
MSTAEQAPGEAPSATPTPVSARVIARRVRAERLTYGAVTLGLTIAPQYESAWPAHTVAAVSAVGGAVWLWEKTSTWMKDKIDVTGTVDVLRTWGRALPLVTGVGLYAVNFFTAGDFWAPGVEWWEPLDAAVWGTTMGAWAPMTRSRGLIVAPDTGAPAIVPPQAVVAKNLAQQELLTGPAARWAASGVAADTKLVQPQWYRPGLPDFEATIVARQGKAVPEISETSLAAIFDFPVGSVLLLPIPGSGPGRKRLIARPTLGAPDSVEEATLEGKWASRVTCSGGAAPGVELIDHRLEDNRLVLLVAALPGKTIRLPHPELCSAMGVNDPSCLVIETDGVRQGVVSIYEKNPLLNVRKATVADLTMDAKGRINIGIRHDGKPAKVRLWDPDQGALRGITAGATGAGKSVFQLLLLAAEKCSGIVSFVGDLQGGKSLPEAEGNVDWFAKGEYECLGQLLAAHAVMKYRERMSANRGDFAINKPWRLLNVTLDEINRLLSHPDDRMRKLAAWLIADIQKTGRKVGVGIRLSVQSLHLKDLGDEEAIRQQGKAGMVVLMRTLSSSTREMGLDGIEPPGFQMSNIPARIYEDGQIEALFHGKDDEDGESTAGMAYVFVDGRAEFMRTFYAEKTDGRYLDLLELFGDAPPVTLTPEEQEVAGEAYAARNDPEYLKAILNKIIAAALKTTTKSKGGANRGDDDFDEEEDYGTFTTDFNPPEAPAPPTVEERILEVLMDGPKHMKDIRAALPDIAPGTVGNTMTTLKENGLTVPVSRGVHRLADQPAAEPGPSHETDVALLRQAAEMVISTQFGSTSMLSRKLRISPDLAGQVMDALAEHGIVGHGQDGKARDVLMSPNDLDQALQRLEPQLQPS